MAMFVHLAAQSQSELIRRNGIHRARRGIYGYPAGVFAVPVIRDFFASHQWLRELNRRGNSPRVGIYFRIPDGEPVWLGPYAQNHQEMTAAQAVAKFDSCDNSLGWEVIIPRAIRSKEIHCIRQLCQLSGWRFYPTAKGRAPLCPCKYCTRGEYGARRLRERLAARR